MNTGRPSRPQTSGSSNSTGAGDVSQPALSASAVTGSFQSSASTTSLTTPVSSLTYSMASPLDSGQSTWSNSQVSVNSWNTFAGAAAGGDSQLWSNNDPPVSRDGLWTSLGAAGASGATAWSADLGGNGASAPTSASLWGERGMSLSANGHGHQASGPAQGASQSAVPTSPTSEWSTQAVSRSNSLPWGGSSPPSSVWGEPSPFEAASASDSQTWAQAVGKSLPVVNPSGDSGSITSPKSPEPLTDERDRLISQAINCNEPWGRSSIDQSSPWELGDVRSDRLKQQMESNVWPNEPPNGTGIWDAFYANSGEKSSRWQARAAPRIADQPAGGSSWPNEPQGANEHWDGGSTGGNARGARGGGGGGGGMYWNEKPLLQSSLSWEPSDGLPGKRCQNMWMDERSPGPQWEGGWMGGRRAPGVDGENWGGEKTHENAFWGQGQGAPRNTTWTESHWAGNGMDNVAKWTSSSDPDYGGRRNNQQAPYGRINSRPEQQMRVHAMKQLMHMGFKKEDAQHALITHNMDVDRAISDLVASRDREMQHHSGMLPNDPAMMSAAGGMNASGQQSGPEFGFGGPRGRHHVGPGGNAQMGGGPMPMGSSSGQTHPHQQQQQQQLMRQHIAQQLRMAVQNRLINPNMLNANLTNRELVPFQQLLQYQNSLNMQRQRLSQVQQQAQMASNNPVLMNQLRQQQEALMQNIAAMETQIKMLSQNLNTLRSGGNNAQGGPQQQAAVTPQGCRGGGVEASELSSRLAELRFANNQPPHSHHQQQQHQHQQQHQSQQQQHQQHWNRSGGGHMVSDIDGHSSKLQQVHSASNLQTSMGMNMPHNNVFGRGSSLHPSSSDPSFSMIHDWRQEENDCSGLEAAVAAAVDVPEFVPGQPWQGISSSTSAEDPNATLGSARPGLLSLNNDHLERLSTTTAEGGLSGQRTDASGTSIGGRNWAADKSAFSPVTGGSRQLQPTNCLLVRNILPTISMDVVKVLCEQYGPLASLQPNLHAGWVLVRFVNREDAIRAQRSLTNRCGTVEYVSEAEAARYIQEIQALATRFAATAGGNHAASPSSGAAIAPPPSQGRLPASEAVNGPSAPPQGPAEGGGNGTGDSA